MKFIIISIFLVSFVNAQRGHYAGSSPITGGLKSDFVNSQPQQQQQSRGDVLAANQISQPSNPSITPYSNVGPQFNPYNPYVGISQPFLFPNNLPFNGFYNGR
ncbi:hypothetical protein PVAND_015343 [Polypedilum vanderplanki]|uniref:Uncharacterized protein n=1 Tax=Polypedilum vanderplanki TaxID=319348 RepID=A0A9J6BCR2_POLVA|nr:hypothetical protein PVAND_015343 [Polypedilum vanderplanki]